MKFTREELEAEIAEKSRDLAAFGQARDLVRRRVLEVAESKSRLTPLPVWSGTDAVLGSLDLAISAIERTIDELRELLAQENVKHPFTLVQGGSGGERAN